MATRARPASHRTAAAEPPDPAPGLSGQRVDLLWPQVHALALHPDGAILAGGLSGSTVSLWSVEAHESGVRRVRQALAPGSGSSASFFWPSSQSSALQLCL